MKNIFTTTLLAATFVATTVIAQPAGIGGNSPKKDRDKVVAKVGEAAPAFSLVDQWETTHTLKAYYMSKQTLRGRQMQKQVNTFIIPKNKRQNNNFKLYFYTIL